MQLTRSQTAQSTRVALGGRNTMQLRYHLRRCSGKLPTSSAHRKHRTTPTVAAASSSTSLQNMEKAVKEGRMVSRREADIRKVVGLAWGAFSTYNVYSQGLHALSPPMVVISFAFPMAFLATGILNLCGIAFRLWWSVEDGDRFRMGATPCPPQYQDFMKAKRMQMILVTVGSGAIAAIGTFAAYSAAPAVAMDATALLVSVGKGLAAYWAIILVWSHFTGRDVFHKLGW